MTWAMKDAATLYQGTGLEGEAAMFQCAAMMYKIMMGCEGAKERYLLHVAFQLCEQGLPAREINFTRIEQMWNEGAEPKTAISHFLLENQQAKP